MEYESYLCYEESVQLIGILKRYGWRLLPEMGLYWVVERGQYQIANRKLWMLAKIKYGI